MLSTLITLAVEILTLPEVGIRIANVVLNVALIAMGWQLWQMADTQQPARNMAH